VVELLIFIGTGLSLKHLTIEALKYIQLADKIIVDTYTSLTEDLDILLDYLRDKEIVYASRRDLEGEAIDRIIEEARYRNIAILVPGDPFIATTHDAIRVEAYKKGVKVIVVNGLTIHSIIASRTGLQAYRFGKMITLTYPDSFKPYSTIETIYDNLSRNLHTLLLLDYRVDEGRYMSINEAVDILLSLDDKRLLARVLAVGVARLCFRDEYIIADRLIELKNYNYPKPPHSIVIVAKPHPIELDNLFYICNLPRKLYEMYQSRREYP